MGLYALSPQFIFWPKTPPRAGVISSFPYKIRALCPLVSIPIKIVCAPQYLPRSKIYINSCTSPPTNSSMSFTPQNQFSPNTRALHPLKWELLKTSSFSFQFEKKLGLWFFKAPNLISNRFTCAILLLPRFWVLFN